MNFLVHCTCHRPHSVPESAAGSVIDCHCGQKVQVPALSEMRRQAGLAAYTPRAALVIAHMLAAKQLPPPRCARCDAEEAECVDATAICERAPTRGGDSAGRLLFAAFIFGWWWVLLFPRRSSDIPDSEDRLVRVPLRLCRACRGALRPPAGLSFLYLLSALLLGGAIPLLFVFFVGGLVLLAIGLVLLFCIHLLKDGKKAEIRRLWRAVPVYQQLLDQYPDANLVVGE